MRQAYVREGAFVFGIQARSVKLVVYESPADPYARSLFIPFSDQTSGRESYAAGRYLDHEEQGGDDYESDFNMAYNPYFAYSDEYTCLIHPVETSSLLRFSPESRIINRMSCW